MKQTNKCKCECHIDKLFKGIHCFKCQIELKSKSQKIPSQTETSVGNVRASEEVLQNGSITSSVPYTPLTKDKIYEKIVVDKYSKEIIYMYLDKDVLSALNGLREDICRCEEDSKCGNCYKIKKWFPIIDEEEK